MQNNNDKIIRMKLKKIKEAETSANFGELKIDKQVETKTGVFEIVDKAQQAYEKSVKDNKEDKNKNNQDLDNH